MHKLCVCLFCGDFMLQLLLQNMWNRVILLIPAIIIVIMCIKKVIILNITGNVPGKYYAVVCKVDYPCENFKNCFAVNLVLPVSRNFLDQIVFLHFP